MFLGKNDTIKIGDLGIARELETEEDMAKTVTGTPYYLSPEICMAKGYNNKTDVWSLGIVTYELCVFNPPFMEET